jgi:7,8-dihydropterin-6-yl-methyl-4-(beta-D-ribofuranosyl)aminobenzene 5'-phosphate synthase
MRKYAAILAFLPPIAVAIMSFYSPSIANFGMEGQIMNQQSGDVTPPDINHLSITVVYDNNPYKQELQTEWGFSAYITGAEKTILFDTGGSSILLDNMEKLEIEPNSIDTVVLSHIHADHTGGLNSFLEKNSNIIIYPLQSFPTKFKENARSYGVEIVEVNEHVKICENVYSTGQLGTTIKEQSLIIRTNKGLVIITGCAHPGIVKIITKAKEFLNDNILFVMGGFHLGLTTKGDTEKIISSLKQLGVQYVAPTHCTGEKARKLFARHFGPNYIDIGAGKTITTTDLVVTTNSATSEQGGDI